MSMLKAPKAVSRRHELREDQLATATARGLTFFEQHRTLLIGAGVALVVLIAGVIGWGWWQARQDRAAAEALGGILAAYEQGNYEEALEGTPESAGLLDIAREYGSTNTGNLATFFAADALYQLERYDEALELFEGYDGDGDILGASALAGQAAIYEQRGEHERAADLYRRAADAYASAATAPDYLMAAGRNYEAADNYAAAQQAYERFLADWDETPNAALVEALLARAEAAQAE
jgi:predicted negative regulator of RcsB-dependent stress response